MDVQALLSACQQGDLVTVKECLTQGLAYDSQDIEEVTPLQIAAANNQESVVQLLLSSGVFIDQPNKYGWTPLMLAARHGHASIVLLLLKNKAKVNAHNKLGMRPLVAAAWSGHTSTVRLLLEAGAVSDCPLMTGSAFSECDLTSLMAASLNGHDPVLKVLLDKEMSVNQASTATKLTPLMMAACNGHKQTAQILVEQGADMSMMNVCGKTALDIAKIRGKREVTAYLDDKTITISIRKISEEAEVIAAIKDANLDYLRQLLQENPSCCSQKMMDNGVTPLMYAAILGHVEVVSLLISAGDDIDIDAQDFINGWTALMYAVYHRQKVVINYLIHVGANVNIQAKNGYTALDLACMLDNTDEDVRSFLAGKTDSLADFYKHKSVSTPSALHRALQSFKKFSPNERYPPKPVLHKDSPFKAWLGGMAHRLHNLKPTRPSRSLSSTPDVHLKSPSFAKSFLPASESAFYDENEHVYQVKQLPRCSLSSLRSPYHCQSDNLSKQLLEAVIPPLPPTPSSDIDREGLCMMSGQRISVHSMEMVSSTSICLQLKNLLKHFGGDGDNKHSKKANISSSTKLSSQLFASHFKPHSVSNEDISEHSCSIHCNRKCNEKKCASVIPENSLFIPFTRLNTSESSSTEWTLTPFQKGNECLNELRNENQGKNLSSIKEVRENLPLLLEQFFLERYIKKFEDQEVDLEAFKNLTDEDLKEIGVQSLQPRQQLLEIIRQLQQELAVNANYS